MIFKSFNLLILFSYLCFITGNINMTSDNYHVQNEIAKLKYDNDGLKEICKKCRQEYLKQEVRKKPAMYQMMCEETNNEYKIENNNKKIEELMKQLDGHPTYMKLTKDEKKKIEKNRIKNIEYRKNKGKKIDAGEQINLDITLKRIERIERGTL